MNILALLRSVLPDCNVVPAGDIDKSLLHDQRRRLTSNPLCAVFPITHDDVVTLINFCNQNNIGIVPQGGNTGLVGGAIANERQILVNFAKMNKIIECNATDRLMIVQAGCTLSQINAIAGECGLIFPLGLSVADRCMLGGNMATNAGGINVLRHGMTKQLVYGIKGVLANGTTIDNLVRVPKNNVGFDVNQLFLGTEGSMGLITHASLKLVTKPQNTISMLIACDSINDVNELFHDLISYTADMVESFEIISRVALQLVIDNREYVSPIPLTSPWFVLTQIVLPLFATPEHTIPLLPIKSRFVHFAITKIQQDQLWYPRTELPWVQGISIKHDISVPRSNMALFLQKTNDELQQTYPNIRPIVFGHFGDCNIHYNLLPPVNQMGDNKLFLDTAEQLHAIVYKNVIINGGSISAEHGIGRVKKHWYNQYCDAGVLNTVKL